ncbi:hypothetical protein Ancab_028714 [Ancistrocladus abbreviatus]
MEAATKLQQSSTSADQTLSPSKQQMIRNGRRIPQTRRCFSSRHQTENFINTASTAALIHGGGMFLNHPPVSLSSSFTPLSQLLHPHDHQHQCLQPPLLPLPFSRTFHSLPTRGGGPGGKSSSHSLSLSPTNRTKPKPKDPTPKKSPPPPKRQPSSLIQKVNPNPCQKQELQEAAISESGLIVGSTKWLGSDPESMKMDVNLTRVLLDDFSVEVDEMETFSRLVFSLSPPPSSLPLPKFLLRPKVSS